MLFRSLGVLTTLPISLNLFDETFASVLFANQSENHLRTVAIKLEYMHLPLCKESSQIVAEAAQTCPVSENRGDQFSVPSVGMIQGVDKLPA